MTMLSAAFREQVKQTKDLSQINEMTYSVSYPTGFPNFDIVNGYIQEINGRKRLELGLSDGSINMLISDSGLGKTTFATQIACNIAKQFKTSCVFYEQAEVGTNIQRIKNLTGFLSDDGFRDRFVVRDAGITIESIYNRIKMVHDIKMKNPDDYLYDTGLTDHNGKHILKFEPTIWVADSIPMIMTGKNAEADDTNNMVGAQNAKGNSEYYKKIVPLCRAANIIMILINHITTDINTGIFHKKPEFPYLKEGEHLPGGKTLHYVSNIIARIELKTKLKDSEGLGIIGSIVNLDMVKSRTNKTSKARCILVFDLDAGYDADLSMFVTLKEEKLIEGAGAFLKIPGSDIKFAQKNFKQIMNTNPEFARNFAQYSMKVLIDRLVADYERIKEDESKAMDYTSPYMAILDEFNNSL